MKKDAIANWVAMILLFVGLQALVLLVWKRPCDEMAPSETVGATKALPMPRRTLVRELKPDSDRLFLATDFTAPGAYLLLEYEKQREVIFVRQFVGCRGLSGCLYLVTRGAEGSTSYQWDEGQVAYEMKEGQWYRIVK